MYLYECCHSIYEDVDSEYSEYCAYRYGASEKKSLSFGDKILLLDADLETPEDAAAAASKGEGKVIELTETDPHKGYGFSALYCYDKWQRV